MKQDIEQLFKDTLGEQFTKITGRMQDLARDAVKDDFARLHQEIGELRSRLTRLEEERAENAAESLEGAL